MKALRALTVIQPWATLLTLPHHDGLAVKPVENRTWEPRGLAVGDHLAIHAGAKVEPDEWAWAMEVANDHGIVVPLLDSFRRASWAATPKALRAWCAAAAPYSAIIGVAVFDGATTTPRGTERFFFGPVGWYFRDVVSIAPLACRGALGLWTVPQGTRDEVRGRWSLARAAGRVA